MIIDDYENSSPEKIVSSIPDSLKRVKHKPKADKLNLVLTAIVILGVLLTGLHIQSTYSQLKTATSNSSINSWLSSFMKKDYDACDSYVSNSNYKISSYFVSYYNDSELYEETLDNLVNSITSIRVTSCEGNRYSIEVTFKPYKEITDLKVNKEEYGVLSESYKNGSISDAELTERLNSFYADIYRNSCFEFSSESETMTFYLTESNGKVEDTIVFVEGLLDATNITKNLEFYQNNAKGKIVELEK